MIYYILTAIVCLCIGRLTKVKSKPNIENEGYKGQVIFEDILVRKRHSIVWIMHENKAEEMAINYVKCHIGVNGPCIEYNVRKIAWPIGCIGIDNVPEYKMFDSREELLSRI
jgi:hypothetical protein